MYKWSFLVICFIFILASCKKPPFGGGGCTPGPNNTHAFLTYTGVINQNSTAIFEIEFDQTHNSARNFSNIPQTGYFSNFVIKDPGEFYFLSDSGGKTNMSIFSSNFSGFNSAQKVLPSNYNGISVNSFSIAPNSLDIALIYNDCPACAIAFLGFNLGIFDPSTKLIKNLTLAYSHVDWAKDGSKLYFDNRVNGIPHIFSINPDGSGLIQLTNTPFGEEYPAISPDGKTLAIASFMDAEHKEEEVCFMNTDGTNLRKITNLGNTTIAHQPCWSPLADKFFFSCYNSVNNTVLPHIFLSKLDGSGVQQFTNGNGETQPSAGFIGM